MDFILSLREECERRAIHAEMPSDDAPSSSMEQASGLNDVWRRFFQKAMDPCIRATDGTERLQRYH